MLLSAGETLKQVEGAIEFSDVSFAYPSRPGALRAAAAPACCVSSLGPGLN